MREDPHHDLDLLTTCLATDYAIAATAIRFLPLGYDARSAVYDVTANDGQHSFVKVWTGEILETNLLVPRTLSASGIPHILAPLPTTTGNLSAPLDDLDASVIVYPFIQGQSAMEIGLTADQWQTFGQTLRAVHESNLAEQVHKGVRHETFTLPSAALVRRMISIPDSIRVESPVADAFFSFWDDRAQQIEELLVHVEAMGQELQRRSLPRVLCHADIHAANILVGDDGQIWLVDWDGPLLAPRERDLLFVIGSRIARPVEPDEESHFFAGYGPTTIDPLALIYFRYERIIEDLGEIARQVFLDDEASEEARAADAALAMSFFAPGADIDRAETVSRTQWGA